MSHEPAMPSQRRLSSYTVLVTSMVVAMLVSCAIVVVVWQLTAHSPSAAATPQTNGALTVPYALVGTSLSLLTGLFGLIYTFATGVTKLTGRVDSLVTSLESVQADAAAEREARAKDRDSLVALFKELRTEVIGLFKDHERRQERKWNHVLARLARTEEWQRAHQSTCPMSRSDWLEQFSGAQPGVVAGPRPEPPPLRPIPRFDELGADEAGDGSAEATALG